MLQEEVAGEDEGNDEKNPVSWIFHRLSFMARKKGEQ